MNILGIHDGHNASIALMQNGKITFAFSEERLARVKNKGGFPVLALERALKDSGVLTLNNIDCIAFSGKKPPIPEWYEKDKILRRYKEQLLYKKSDKSHLVQQIKKIVKKPFYRESTINEINRIRIENLAKFGTYNNKILFLDHHQCHAAAAYYSAGNYDDRVLCLTNDGGGDGLCATVSICEDGKLERIAEVDQIHSVASLYARATFILGMMPLEHEYKLMGMAPYGYQKIARELSKKILHRFEFPSDNNLIWQKKSILNKTSLWSSYLQEVFNLVRFDIVAATLQIFVEEITIKWIKKCIKHTGISKLVLSGGLFMNVKLNKLILELPEVESVFIMPSCSDESNSIGAAYLGALHGYFNISDLQPLKNLYLGPMYKKQTIGTVVDSFHFNNEVLIEKHENIEDVIADLLSQGQIVANYSGREEFGARALGNRSILSDPSKLENIVKLNKMIKQRDFWMPFAGLMTDYQAKKNLKNLKNHFAPYMIMAFDTNDSRDFIAATHPYDNSIRPQVLKKEWNPRIYRIIERFELKTGKNGGILNTSFNLHGYPIVSSPNDALDVFNESGLNYLAIEDYLISKKKQMIN